MDNWNKCGICGAPFKKNEDMSTIIYGKYVADAGVVKYDTSIPDGLHVCTECMHAPLLLKTNN